MNSPATRHANYSEGLTLTYFVATTKIPCTHALVSISRQFERVGVGEGAICWRGPCSIHIRLHPAGKEPSVQLCTHTPTLDPPLAQGDASQLDEVPHAGRDDDGLLVRVPCLVVALHLLHHKLGVAQESVLREAVEVEASRGHGGLGGR